MGYNLTKEEYKKFKELESKMCGSNSSNNWNNSTNSSRSKVKHSGAKFTKYINSNGEEKYLTTGWRLNRNKELISIKAITTKNTSKDTVNKDGEDKGWFGSIAVTFTNTVTGEVNFHWGTMERKTGKVVVDSMAFVMNPRAKNGGYAGTFINKNKK
ncbi:hypothetical protein J4771_02370 [Candidatus Kaistella beijingensis]|uniref:hypothetical protein n=1 Tax=Candidatus Kaistella beijingensis TaxID=2820270 RepID=UPI001CC81C19|nr:hypothetical protein [Candidatus Kaistella beijingensis]UBB90221.1 hypothetical protein J4771_02370 [Candidatus Kaistella beijingensis]